MQRTLSPWNIIYHRSSLADVQGISSHQLATRIWVPRVLTASGPLRTCVRSSESLSGAGPRRKVLVVDDEFFIGEVIERILATDHEVEVVTSPDEFLNRLRAGETYDVIFCDLMMPNMTGMDLCDVLLEEFPDLVHRMVFITGGTFTPCIREFVHKHQHQILLKPFQPETLRQRVLDTAPA